MSRMDAVMWFIIDNMFMIDMLLLGLATAARFPRRSYFWLRLPAAAAVCIAAGDGLSQLVGLIFQNTGLDVLQGLCGYLVQFALLVGAFMLCFRMSLWKALYVGAASYFVQHSAFGIDRLITAIFDREIIALGQSA